MATEEEHRHERQAMYGYLGQANAGIGHSNKRGVGAIAPTPEPTQDKTLTDEEQKAEQARELNNRVWGREDLAALQRAVNE